MTAEPVQDSADGASPSPNRRRFSVDEYYQMGELGILTGEDRTELIDGEIIEMAPIGSQHAGHVDRLRHLLAETIGDDIVLRTQNPVRLGDHSEPQPDIAVLESRDDFYASAHPTAEDVLLLVEIADTTLEYDRTVKIPLYARHSIPVVWLLNLQDKAVEVYEKPDTDGYQISHVLRGGAEIEHPGLSLRFEAAELFIIS